MSAHVTFCEALNSLFNRVIDFSNTKYLYFRFLGTPAHMHTCTYSYVPAAINSPRSIDISPLFVFIDLHRQRYHSTRMSRNPSALSLVSCIDYHFKKNPVCPVHPRQEWNSPIYLHIQKEWGHALVYICICWSTSLRHLRPVTRPLCRFIFTPGVPARPSAAAGGRRVGAGRHMEK